MQTIYPLANTVQHYDWGSVDEIPRLLSIDNPQGKPFAELWMGAHPDAPSSALVDRGSVSLARLIEDAPVTMLGEEIAERFDSKLPFLLKLLAASRPLSIQAHPTKEQAALGWKRENEMGIPIDASDRNYKDENHKPEILCALTPFEGLCGFRRLDEIRALFARIGLALPASVDTALRNGSESEALRLLLEWICASSPAEKELIVKTTARRAAELEASDDDSGLWKLIGRLCVLFPNDASVIAPLFLNYVKLSPGEAMYLPAGVLHAYLDGFGVELMANSNNVLRGGLTSKHIDTQELARVLKFEPYIPNILHAEKSERPGLLRYDAPAEEFRLYAAKMAGGISAAALPTEVPSIVVVVEGSFTLGAENERDRKLGKGQSAFIAACAAEAKLEGEGLAFVASAPK